MADAIVYITTGGATVQVGGVDLLKPLMDVVAAAAAAAEEAETAVEAFAGLINTPALDGEDLSFADPAGNVTLGIEKDGTVRVGRLKVKNLVVSGSTSGVTAGAAAVFSGAGNFPADIVHALSYGQSLAAGEQAVPVISTVQHYDSLTFDGGVRVIASGGGLSSRTSFVPLVETYAADIMGGPAGETPCAGFADAVKLLLANEDGLTFGQQSFQILCSAPANPATAIAGLSHGTSPYTNFMNDVTAGASLAAAAGKTFKVLAVLWLQGESDSGNTSYNTQLLTLRSNITADVQAITGQTEPVIFITYGGANATSAFEFQQASDADPLIVHAAPAYPFARIDGVHFTPASSKLFGAYAGRTFKRIIVDGEDWLPMKPVSIFRQGKIAEVKFHVPVKPIVFDTVGFPAQANQGFLLFQADGTTAMTITSVTITQPDTVRIVASATIPANAILRYGYASATSGSVLGGNLRDSDTTTFDGDGVHKQLVNWCQCFQETIA